MSTRLAIQKALYSVLGPAMPNGIETGTPVPVMGFVAEDAPLPLVVIGRHEMAPSDTLDTSIEQHTVTLTAFSEYRGVKEVDTILEAIRDALHYAEITLESGSSISCRILRDDVALDGDGATYTGSSIVTITASLV